MIPAAIDFSSVTQTFEVLTQHAKLAGLLVGTGAIGMHGVRMWWDRRNLQKGSFRRRILFLATRFEEPDGSNGDIVVHFKPIGDEHELHQVIGIPALENQIAHATRRAKNGLLCLKDGKSHKRMMHILERKIQGNDPIGMSGWIAKRPTNDDIFAFMPAYYREEDASMIFVFVVNAGDVAPLKNPTFRDRMIPAAKDHHEESVEMVKKMGEQDIDPENKSAETALVRFTDVTTAKVLAEAA